MSVLASIASFFLNVFSIIVSLPKKIHFKNVLIAIVIVVIILLILLTIKISNSFIIPIVSPPEYITEKDFIIPPRWVGERKTIAIGSLLQLTIEAIIFVPEELDLSTLISEEEDLSALLIEYVVVVRIEPGEEIKFADYYRENSLSGRKMKENIVFISKGYSADFEHRNEKYRVGVLDVLDFKLLVHRWAKIKVSIIN